MLSTISNINLMRKPAVVAGPVWMIGGSTTSGNVSVSNDNGTTWNTYTTGLTTVKGIAYGLTSTPSSPLWVAAGAISSAGRIATSTTSGSSWSLVGVADVSMSGTISAAAYGKNGSGENLFVIGGYSTTGSNIFSSSNGTTWTGVATIYTINAVNGITYGKFLSGTGVWVAVGISTTAGAGVAISTNGSAWTQVSTTSFTSSIRLTSISFGIDNAGNKRWVACSETNVNTSSCSYTLINPTTTSSFQTWSAISSLFMSGRAYSVTFGRSVSGNTFVIAGAVGSATGNTIVTYDGTTTTGYIQAGADPYQGIRVGYLNTGTADSSKFYLTSFPSTQNKITISQYANSWTSFTRNYFVSPNEVNGDIVSSIPY